MESCNIPLELCSKSAGLLRFIFVWDSALIFANERIIIFEEALEVPVNDMKKWNYNAKRTPNYTNLSDAVDLT